MTGREIFRRNTAAKEVITDNSVNVKGGFCKISFKAKKDGKVTSEEIEDITETGKEIIDETAKFIDEQTSKKKDKEEKL